MLDRVMAAVTALPFAMGAAATPAPPEGEEAFSFADPAITESSGLVVNDGLFVTMNDSGDRGRVFVVDPASGETVGTTSWDDEPSDLEALAPAGAGEVWVGDIGDNRRSRDSIEVLRVPVGRGERRVEPERFELVYPDGARDAEGLAVDPATGQLVVVSKEFFGATVFVAPRRLSADRPNRLRAVGPAPPIATDAAFVPDGRHLVVRDYDDAAVLSWPELEEVADLELPDQQQGESVAVDGRGRWFAGTEGPFAPVHRVRLPEQVQAALAPPAEPAPSATEVPGAEPAGEAAPDEADDAADGADGSGAVEEWRWIWVAATAALGIAVLARLRRRR